MRTLQKTITTDPYTGEETYFLDKVLIDSIEEWLQNLQKNVDILNQEYMRKYNDLWHNYCHATAWPHRYSKEHLYQLLSDTRSKWDKEYPTYLSRGQDLCIRGWKDITKQQSSYILVDDPVQDKDMTNEYTGTVFDKKWCDRCLQQDEIDDMYKTIQSYMIGTSGYPKQWFDIQECSQNKVIAQEQTKRFSKYIQKNQECIQGHMKDVLDYIIHLNTQQRQGDTNMTTVSEKVFKRTVKELEQLVNDGNIQILTCSVDEGETEGALNVCYNYEKSEKKREKKEGTLMIQGVEESVSRKQPSEGSSSWNYYTDIQYQLNIGILLGEDDEEEMKMMLDELKGVIEKYKR